MTAHDFCGKSWGLHICFGASLDGLGDPDVVVAMAREDMQGFKRYVKQGREGVGMLFPGIRIRVDQDEESEV